MFVRCYKRGAARLEHSLLWTCYVLMCVCDLLRAVINSLITAPTVLQTLFTKFHDSWSRRFKLINNINKSAGSVWCYHVNMDKKISPNVFSTFLNLYNEKRDTINMVQLSTVCITVFTECIYVCTYATCYPPSDELLSLLIVAGAHYCRVIWLENK